MNQRKTVRDEVRPTTTAIYEKGLKWAIGMKLAAEAGTQKIGIEIRKEKINATRKAAAEFRRLIHQMYNDWCTKNGVVADPTIPKKAQEIISFHVRGLYIDAKVELEYIQQPYKQFVESLLKSDTVLEAYRKILEAKRL